LKSIRLGFFRCLSSWNDIRIGLLVFAALLAFSSLARFEYHYAPALALDRSLDALVGLGVPLWALWSCWRRPTDCRLPGGLDLMSRHGANRRGLALGYLAGRWLTGIPILAAMVTLAWILTGSPNEPRRVYDWATCTGIVILAMFVYFGSLEALMRLSPRRLALGGYLALDFLLGSGKGTWALAFPRAHLRSLLGGTEVLSLSPRSSTLALCLLAALALVCVAGGERR